jgi:hypothetical protein
VDTLLPYFTGERGLPGSRNTGYWLSTKGTTGTTQGFLPEPSCQAAIKALQRIVKEEPTSGDAGLTFILIILPLYFLGLD